MANQPIPKKVKELNNLPDEQPFYTCLLDMHSIMKTSMIDKRMNSDGNIYGMVLQTLIAIKFILSKRDFQYVYAMYDGENSGELKANILIDYKSNRDTKNYNISGVESQYFNEIDKFVKRVLANKAKTITPEKKEEQQIFFEQKQIVQEILDELFVRNVEVPRIEGDDLIAYYVKHKKKNERIFIVSNDGDLTQLVSDNDFVTQYIKRLDAFITEKNTQKYFNIHPKNIVIQKILCGDSSDSIYGVKSLGQKTLHDIIPEIETKPIQISDVLKRVQELKTQRESEKKKPLKVYDNILNQETNGSHLKGKLFETNNKIINLKDPLMTDEAIEEMESIMYNPLDPSDRNLGNVYKIILKHKMDDLINENKFSTFFSTFSQLKEKEIKLYEKWLSNQKS